MVSGFSCGCELHCGDAKTIPSGIFPFTWLTVNDWTASIQHSAFQIMLEVMYLISTDNILWQNWGEY